MAKSRKDNKGRVLRKGETQRSCDGKYVLMLIRKESAGASILRTSWNCGREKLN